MYNPPEKPQQMVAPRMSFSSDFALEPPPPSSGPARAAGDADFEFTPVGSRPMMAADQLFSKGRILPLREARGPVTLRDELRAPDAAAAAGRRVPRWKELLGLKRSHKNKAAAAAPAADTNVDLGEHGDTGQ
ncbi:hypothetical protein QOZ80_8AG0634220 [Eleusine coracana subsp. coracana]|nr:hypothetical protein QOZ80_8AG0634220 [Eleusine coracana subsp. coracana]